ncbi:MAG: prolyl oligopeptidase family serine peptidase [Luteimonas sp.]
MTKIPKLFGTLLFLGLLLVARPSPARDDATALRAAVAAERARPRAPQFDRTAFLSRPTLRDIALSPDGRNVAWLREQGKNRSVWLLPTAGGAPKRVLGNTEAEQLAWSRDGRWLLLQTPRQIFALAAAAGQAGSSVIVMLGGRGQSEFSRTRREFVAVDPSLPAAIIILERPPVVSRAAKRWRLYRVDMHGKQTLLREDAKEMVDFAFDPRGRLAFLLRAEGEGHVIHRVDRTGRLCQVARSVRMQRIFFAATANDGRDLILRTNVGGNFTRLVRLDANGTLHTLHVDPRSEADLDGVVLDPVTREPLIASYHSTIAASYGLTPDAKRHVDAVNRRFPQRNLRLEVGHGERAQWLVHERSGSLKGEQLHLYDPHTGGFRKILDDAGFERGGKPVARLPEAAMARKIAFAYRASDGMRLHGFLLLPPGIDPSKAPLVASVHGGPFNLVRPEFSNDGQFLANRGYIVFQPNFRGSTGHGRDYLFAAQGDFGNGRVQQDIVEGVRYLLAQGIGDAQRVGITGTSFGGYSTLLGVTFQPELFKVGVAAVPPADFGWTLREYLGAGQEIVPGIPMATSMRHLSLDPADGALAKRLADQSPIANAARLRRPLLMLAGGEDERVPIRGVTHYAAKLKSLGKDVSLFVDAEAGHSVDDTRTREAYYYLMERLLHGHLGGVAPQPPDRELRTHIRRNLRLAGRDLKSLM